MQQQYVVLQAIVKVKPLAKGTANLTELEDVINDQASKGYRLHTIIPPSAAPKGLGNVLDRIDVTLVFERI